MDSIKNTRFKKINSNESCILATLFARLIALLYISRLRDCFFSSFILVGLFARNFYSTVRRRHKPTSKDAPKAAPAHPKYEDMVKAAILALKDEERLFRPAIAKYLGSNFQAPRQLQENSVHPAQEPRQVRQASQGQGQLQAR